VIHIVIHYRTFYPNMSISVLYASTRVASKGIMFFHSSFLWSVHLCVCS